MIGWLLAGAYAAASTLQVAYTYHGEAGGAALLEVDVATGQPGTHKALMEGTVVRAAKKLVFNGDGDRLIVTCDEEPKAWVVELGEAPKVISEIVMERETSHVMANGSEALIAVSQGMFYMVDLTGGRVVRTWSSRKGDHPLHPSGRKGEDFHFLGDDRVLISFQKDSNGGKHLGSRLVVFDQRRMRPIHDLQLPRDRPDLHIAADQREQGPNPEIIRVSERHNTLMLTLDLYGAVAFADLDAALEGKWENLTYVPTALDGSWGGAFPDRALQFEVGGTEYLLVSNASQDGGLVLFDVAKREVIHRWDAVAGTEHPVWLPGSRWAATVLSGKVKARTASGLTNVSRPLDQLLVWDMAPLESGGEPVLRQITLPAPASRIIPLNPAGDNRVLLGMSPPEGDVWVVYDLESGTELERVAALGPISRAAVRRVP